MAMIAIVVVAVIAILAFCSQSLNCEEAETGIIRSKGKPLPQPNCHLESKIKMAKTTSGRLADIIKDESLDNSNAHRHLTKSPKNSTAMLAIFPMSMASFRAGRFNIGKQSGQVGVRKSPLNPFRFK